MAITAALVMRPPTRQALAIGLQRSLGTGVGVIIAVALAEVVGENPPALVILLLASPATRMALRPYCRLLDGGSLDVTGVSPVGRSPKEDIMAIRFHRTSLVAGVKGQEAGAFAAEISKYLTESLGIPTTWGMEVGGTFGTMHWFAEYPDMAAFEAGLVKTLTDPGYIEILAKAEDLFVEGSTEDTVIYMM